MALSYNNGQWGFMAYIFPYCSISCVSRANLVCVMPGASAFFHSSVTSLVKNQRKPVKSHPTALTVTSAVLISHKATEEAWHTMRHNIETHTTIHPPVFLNNSHLCSVCVSSVLLCWVCVCSRNIIRIHTHGRAHTHPLLPLQTTVGFTAVIYDDTEPTFVDT